MNPENSVSIAAFSETTREGFANITSELKCLSDKMDAVEKGTIELREALGNVAKTVSMLNADMQEVKGIVDGLLSQGQGHSKKIASEKDRERLRIAQDAEKSFTFEMVCAVLCAVVPTYTKAMVDKRDRHFNGCELINTLMFARQSNERKDVFNRTLAGRNHIELRCQVVTSLIKNTCQNSSFREGGDRSSSNGTSEGIERWRARGYVTTGTIEETIRGTDSGRMDGMHGASEASDGAARKQKRRKVGDNGPLHRKEVGVTVTKSALTAVTGFMNKSRDHVRNRFIRDLGFVLYSGFQGSVRMEHHLHDGGLDIESVPSLYSAQRKMNAAERAAMDDKNMKILRDFIAVRKEMVFRVEYEVQIIGEPDKRFVNRRINLVEVALNFAVAYMQCSDRNMVLRRSEHSLQFIYILAYGFRTILKFQSGAEVGGAQIREINEAVKLLLPGERVSSRFMNEEVLTISRDRYEEMNVDDGGDSVLEESFRSMEEDGGDEEYVKVFVDDEIENEGE